MFEVDEDDRDDAGQYTLAVVGFLFDSTNDVSNEFIQEWNVTREGEFQLDLEYFEELIEDNKIDEYYYYQGSLTTPDCNEIVNWFVVKEPLQISKSQKNLIDSYFKNNPNFANGRGNNRVIQPLNGRQVFKGRL